MALKPEPRRVAGQAVVEPHNSLLVGLVQTARPRQWIKNVLLLAAPFGAGVITHADALARTAIAFVLFCVAASGAYFLNDAADIGADRAHERKQHRPVASGLVPVPLAQVIGAAALVVAIASGFLLVNDEFGIAIASYVAVTLAYTFWLKHEPVLDLAGVAAGFLIRAIAGGVAAEVWISQWFIIVVGFSSLFIVTGKRSAEHLELGDARGDHRITLSTYSETFLRFVRGAATAAAFTAYCVWAFEKGQGTNGALWFELSIIPFVAAMLRYALMLEQGHGGAPEEVFLRDRTLQALGLVWAGFFAAGIYG
ncbi:MAG TPA: decaprenyl-phosphate phosphoribosyltransferase [Acidimicrobiales bacterium]|nr:decaprenyl-phosphate phosphoribosyltransferase [Acidimicrobiales bacterium]